MPIVHYISNHVTLYMGIATGAPCLTGLVSQAVDSMTESFVVVRKRRFL